MVLKKSGGEASDLQFYVSRTTSGEAARDYYWVQGAGRHRGNVQRDFGWSPPVIVARTPAPH
eukprot:4117254-Pyramimonas_sp.AAC.1